MKIEPEMVDIRLAVGVPTGETPIKITCPMHPILLGVEDDKASLAVYRQNLHCFGCSFHVSRRYASLAFLLGLWDGRGREDSEKVREAVRQLKPRLREFVQTADRPFKVKPVWVPPPIEPVMVEGFHQFLLSYARDKLRELERVRGLSRATIIQHKLGYTGTHFTLPVYNLAAGIETIRYRADDEIADTEGPDYRKYEGTFGRNAPVLYPLRCLYGVSHLDELWVVEGEFDALASNQAQARLTDRMTRATLTITNGASNVAKIPEMVKASLPDLFVKRWVVATDQDAAGEQAAQALLSVLLRAGGRASRACWKDAKDLTEFYARGGLWEEIRYE